MSHSIAQPVVSSHRVLPDQSGRMAKADLRSAEVVDFRAQIGACVAQATRRYTLDELSGLLKKDPRQVRRWMSGEERPQFDVLFAIEAIRQPLVIALAGLAECDVETVVRIRVRA